MDLTRPNVNPFLASIVQILAVVITYSALMFKLSLSLKASPPHCHCACACDSRNASTDHVT